MFTYPRVLVVALGRINGKDMYNNGLFLRNIFGSEWPKDNLAQIYSSGSTGDSGFFGHYYCLAPHDRMLGGIFYRIKPATQETNQNNSSDENNNGGGGFKVWLKKTLTSLLVDSGLYELIFRPKLSVEMKEWVNDFKPDIILAQGYNLTFSWLPLLLKKETGARLAILATDDWPKYQYAGMHGEPSEFKWLVRPYLSQAANDLFSAADVPFAFGMAMADEYEKRFKKKFIVINHSDSQDRFISAEPVRVHPIGVKSIVAIGTFNKFRYPLLQDLNEACQRLNDKGLCVRGAVLSSAVDTEGMTALASSNNLDFFDDPGNDALPSYLKGADVLFLAEGFDPEFVEAIELSISSKAHLFMFARRPIIVYAGAGAGISKYAESSGWAALVSVRDTTELTRVLENLLTSADNASALVSKASEVAESFHTHSANRDKFLSALA